MEKTALPRFERLKGDVKTDVLVVGGGMAGLLCAYFLKRAGVDCLLAEAGVIGGGITRNTTAKITVQHGLIYDSLIRRFGTERAGMYLRANLEALEEYRKLCRTIDCGFEERDSFVYSLDDRAALEREARALERLGAAADCVESLPLPFPVAGAVRMAGQAQFHPLRFLAALARGLPVCEHTAVRELGEHRAVTDGGVVTAEKILVTTHFPMLNKHGSYFLKLYQHRSYVLALENGPDVHGMYVDEAADGLSFRNYQNFLLVGGGGHRTGKKGGGWTELERLARRCYPEAMVRARWATQDCMSLDGVPYIGPYSARTRDLYVATGFNKWGMTSSMAAARLLTDRVLGKEHPDARVFSPSRSILRPQLAFNGAAAAVNLLTPTAPRCPHMGCALKWNARERTWDCPCHGSRFTREGRLIDNPATGGLNRSAASEDAGDRGIGQGDLVEVFNDRGKVRIPALVTERIMRGVTAMSQGGWYRPDGQGRDTRGSINVLTDGDHPSPLAKGNPQHTNLVEVKRAGI